MPKEIRAIPPVREFLLDIKIFDQFAEVVKKHELPEDRLEEFLDLTDAIIKGELELAQMPSMVASAFNVDENKAKLICADIAGYRLLPLDNYLPGTADQIVKWGGKLEDYPLLRIEKKIETTDDRLVDLATKIGLDVPEYIKKRFAFIARGYLKKERSKEATITLMKRPINIGGLALDDTQVANMFKFIEEQAEAVVSEEPQEVREAPVVVSEVKEIIEKPVESSQPSVSKEDLKEKLAKLEALIKLRKPKPVQEPRAVAEPKVAAPQKPKEGALGTNVVPPLNLAQKKDQPAPVKAKQESTNPQIDLTAQGELTKVTPEKTSKQDLPTQPTVKPKPHALTTSVPVISGEMINDDEKADIAVAKRQLQKRGNSNGKADFDKKINITIQELTKQVAAVCKKNRIPKKAFDKLAYSHIRGTRDVNKTYELLKQKLAGDDLNLVMKALETARASIQGKSGEIMQAQSDVKDLNALEKEVLNERHATITRKISDEDIEPFASNAQVSASRTKEEELTVQKTKIDQEKIAKAQVASKPIKAKAKLSVPSAPPQAGKVEDIKYTRKLVGPIDELGTMGSVEFRRLSTDPNEAVRKIEDKLALLESTRYEDRISGVKAWRQSPINKLYVSMAQEALQKGISVAEVASERRNTGQESLSPAEVQAIVGLNNRIKF
ncbi:MAG: hypothetical protein ABH846_00355 [Patescibacteria group bacterium]